MTLSNTKVISMFIASFGILSACGGGSDTGTNPRTNLSSNGSSSQTPIWEIGQFPNKDNFKDFCEIPRTGIDNFSGQTFPDRSGTAMHEKMWLRSWSDDTYLWYNEVDDNDPILFQVPEYFEQLKTNEFTSSGSLKDNFHFSQSTEDYNKRTQSGVTSGYGISWELISPTSPRKLTVRYTEPGSPAELAGIKRGYDVRFVDGVDFINASLESDVNILNRGLFPENSGEHHTITFVKRGEEDLADNMHVIELNSANIELVPVQNVTLLDTPVGKMGYMQFNSHISVAQEGLIDAIQQFRDQNATDLIVDLRYNGGGLLAMASQFAYMVAGSSQSNGLIFESTQYNDKNPNKSPITGEQLSPTPFYDREIDFAASRFTSRTLPSLNLTRLFVLSTDSTCSASEAFINGLRGINVEVILIGDTTCGKPYGFSPQDNCGTTYFTIQFKGVNQQGFGEYSDGFTPTPTPQFLTDIQGCPVADDFMNQLGNENEALLSAAITYAQTGLCPVQISTTNKTEIFADKDALFIHKPNTILDAIILENKFMSPILEPTE